MCIYLCFSELESRCQEKALWSHHVLLPCELFLQSGQLLIGKTCAHALWFSCFVFIVRVDCCFGQYSICAWKKVTLVNLGHYNIVPLSLQKCFLTVLYLSNTHTLWVHSSTACCLVAVRRVAEDGIPTLRVHNALVVRKVRYLRVHVCR